MIWLACETSTQKGSLALFNHNTLLNFEYWERDGSHSEYITLSFQKLLNNSKILPQQIDFLAVGTGPGSFTGIRVGINFIRTLAHSLNKRVLNLNSLHLLALQDGLKSSGRIRVMQYAFRNLIYTAEYEITSSTQEVVAPRAMTTHEIAPLITEKTLVLGTGYDKLKNQFSEEVQSLFVRDPKFDDLPSALFFKTLVEQDLYRAQLTDWIHTIPLYIRASEAEEKLKSGSFKALN